MLRRIGPGRCRDGSLWGNDRPHSPRGDAALAAPKDGDQRLPVPTIAILLMSQVRDHGQDGSQIIRTDPIGRRLRKQAKDRPMSYVAAYAVAALVMGGLDYLWLSNASGPLYHKALGAVMAENPNMTAAVIFYLGYIAGILVFAVRPALASGDWKTAALFGALFGFFAYFTYDLTNLATLKVWSVKVTVIDIIWGTFLTGVTASAAAFVALKFAK